MASLYNFKKIAVVPLAKVSEFTNRPNINSNFDCSRISWISLCQKLSEKLPQKFIVISKFLEFERSIIGRLNTLSKTFTIDWLWFLTNSPNSMYVSIQRRCSLSCRIRIPCCFRIFTRFILIWSTFCTTKITTSWRWDNWAPLETW